MNAATRKRLLAYAIPVDLVIVATGVGLLVPGITPLAIIVIFVVAVALSAFKSGWGGAIAAMAISGLVLFTLFKRSIETEQIGWFLAASILVSMPLAAWSNARRARRERIDKSQAVLIEPLLAAPPRSVEEEAAAALFDEGYVVQRETHARTEGERIAKAAMDADVARLRNQLERQHAEQLEQRAELQASYDRDRAELKAQFDAARLSIDAERAELQQQLDEERRRPAVIEKQLEREHAEQLERQRAEFQASYNRDRAELKAQFDAARLSIDAERAELQQQLDEERRRPAVIEKHVDEEALAQRLEHLHAEWQQQFDRELQPRIDAQLAAQRQALERDSKREIDKIQRAAEERIAALRAELDTVNAQLTALSKTPPPQPARQAAPAVQRGIFSRFFQHGPKPQLKLNRRTIAGENTATRRAAAAALAESSATRRANAARAGERKARVLFLESRRATADTAAPRLRQLGIEVAIVERLVDAVDELYRFRPDIAFIDADLSDFDKAYRTIADQAKNLPLVLTSRNAATIPDRPHAGIAVRPYIIDQVVDIARAAVNDPHSLLAKQRKAEPEPARERYDVVCYNCRVVFDAADADWCSCLTQERTVVCTNCLTCFCKGTPAYKETFWLAAPPALFERKAADLRRQSLAISANAAPSEVKRPLVMLVDADEDNQAILQRVCANLGYGSAGARNGQEGLDLARKLRPNLILADAFLPHLDGREMCRKLKEDSALAGTRIVVMTGLYADIEAKSDAVKRFRIDDYLAKPVSITDLINLLQRHLEGVLDLPAQESLYALHRKGIPAEAKNNTYEVACFNCGDMFDAAKAPWCAHAGDKTLLCEHCGYCFCDASQYRQRFWAGAPAELFERKVVERIRDGATPSNPQSDDPNGVRPSNPLIGEIGIQRPGPTQSTNGGVTPSNPLPAEVPRPLVLLAGADEATELMVRTIASSLGYGIVVARDNDEGLTLEQEYEPDLILADALARHLDGRELCRRAKEDPAAPPLKTVVMTGRYADREYLDEAVSKFGIDGFIPKPLAIGDLLYAIRKHLPNEVQSMQR